MPTARATASAVCRLSPVIITTSRPRRRIASTAERDSGFTWSATATRPAKRPSTAANIGVFPSPASRAASASAPCIATSRERRSRAFPRSRARPSTRASIPCPAIALNPVASVSATPRSDAPRTMASPSGCSLPRSADATKRRSSASPTPSAGRTSVSAGSPRVMVPVLSSMTVSSVCAVSSVSPPLMSTPCSAPLPVPTMMAVGVARPRAQGQAMMSTETKATRAMVNRVGSGAATYQTANVAMATHSTTGVKTPLMTSARRAIGALAPCASCTSCTICWSAVSRPTLVASKRNEPVLLSVAPNTSSPGPFSTGRLSPVSIASSTVDVPSATTPSTGIFSPGRTITVSPGTTSSTGMSISRGCPSTWRTTRAVLACRSISRRIASLVCPLARDSSSRPKRMRAMITPAASK